MCGITGYSGSKFPDIAKIKLTSIFIRDRGKDSVGFLMNNFVTRGVWEGSGKDNGDPLSFFNFYYFPSANLTKHASNTVLCHNRSSTRGAKTKENSHPFVYEKDGNFYYFMKNGTLTYSSELNLCEKYSLDKKDFDVDSKLLGHIIVHHGWDVLTEYSGGAALVLYSTAEPNTIYIFRGKSLENGVPTEERPLFYYKTKTGLYFSSTKGSLVSAHDVSEDKIEEFQCNVLYKIEEGKIVEETVYDRSNIESKPVFTNSSSNDYYGYSNYQGGRKNTGYNTEETKYYSNGNQEKSPIKVKDYPDNSICFYQGHYWANGHPANGCFLLDENGIIYGKSEYEYKKQSAAQRDLVGNVNEYYFYKGLRVKDKEAITKLKNIFTKLSKISDNSAIMKEVSEYLHDENVLFFFGFSQLRNATKLYAYQGQKQIESGYWTVRPKFCPYTYNLFLSTDKYTIEKKKPNEQTSLFLTKTINKEEDIWNPTTIINTSKTIYDLFNENFNLRMSEMEVSSTEKTETEKFLRKLKLLERSVFSSIKQSFNEEININPNSDEFKTLLLLKYLIMHPSYGAMIFEEIEDSVYAILDEEIKH